MRACCFIVMFRPICVFFPYAYELPIRIWAIFLSPYAYWLPVRIRAAHTGIAGIPWFAYMRMSARTRMHAYLPDSFNFQLAIAIAVVNIGGTVRGSA